MLRRMQSPSRRSCFGIAGRLVLLVSGIPFAGTAEAEITLSMELVPGQSVASGEAFSLEVFITSTESMFLYAVQVDFPCTILPAAGGSGSISAIAPRINVADQSDPASGSVPWLFAFQDEDHAGGLRPLATGACRASGAFNAGESPYLLPANLRRYIATMFYAVSECAAGSFSIRFEGIADPPTNNDLTRVVSDQLAPLSFISADFDAMPAPCTCKIDDDCNNSIFCDGIETCEADHCQLGADPCPGQRCLEAENRCAECITDADCHDDDPCTIVECSLESHTCQMFGATGPACSDELFCNGVDHCVAGECLPIGQPSCSPNGLRPHCDESQDLCVECLTNMHCTNLRMPVCDTTIGVCVPCRFDADCNDGDPCTTDSCRPDRFICDHADRPGEPCDDELPCTINETCQLGVCEAGGSNCGPGEQCDHSTGLCIPLVCPDGSIQAISPANDTVDSRQPWPPGQLMFRQGIGDASHPIVVAIAAAGVPSECFELCESSADPELGANLILTVDEGIAGQYNVRLLRPITPLAVTTISYMGGGSVRFVSHPGNVDASLVADAIDVLALIDHLTGEAGVPFGSFSADIDHSGESNLLDLVREIDLLQAAAAYLPYADTSQPADGDCP